MSVPTAELSATRPSARSGAGTAAWRPWLHGGRLLIVLVTGALVLSILSLLIPSTPSYDPWAWLVWGREIIHLDLHTAGGPSWKPLPMIFTTVSALFGRAQPDLWLVVARTGTLMSAALSFKLAFRLTRSLAADPGARTGTSRAVALIAPVLAGVLAAGSLVNSPGFVSNGALGYSEGVAVALMLGAVDRILDGRHRQAFVLGLFVALDRPETWIVWGAYGLWLAWRDPGARRLVIGLFVLNLALWFGPDGFSGVTRAQHPRSNSAAFTSCPLCTVLRKQAWPMVLNRIKIPAIIAIVVALGALWRSRELWRRSALEARGAGLGWLAAIGAFGYLWWFGIALETQVGGFSGNSRYLAFGVAPVGIAGGIAWGWFASAYGGWLGRAGAAAAALRRLGSPRVAGPGGALVAVALFLAVPPWITDNVIDLQRTHRALVYQAHLREDLSALVDRFGARRLLACGSVMTEAFQVPMVAWKFGVRTARIIVPPSDPHQPGPAPETILQARDTRSATLLPLPETVIYWERHGARYTYVHRRTFRLFTACRR